MRNIFDVMWFSTFEMEHEPPVWVITVKKGEERIISEGKIFSEYWDFLKRRVLEGFECEFKLKRDKMNLNTSIKRKKKEKRKGI